MQVNQHYVCKNNKNKNKKKNRYFAENCRWVPLMLGAAKGIMDKKEESKL